MSQEQPMPNPALAPRRPSQIRLAKLRTAPGLSLIGLPELIGLAGAATNRNPDNLCLLLFLLARAIASDVAAT